MTILVRQGLEAAVGDRRHLEPGGAASARYRQLPLVGSGGRLARRSAVCREFEEALGAGRQPRCAGSHSREGAWDTGPFTAASRGRDAACQGRWCNGRGQPVRSSALQPRPVPPRDERGVRPPAAVGDRWHGSPDGAAHRDLRGRATCGHRSRRSRKCGRRHPPRRARGADRRQHRTELRSRLLPPVRVAHGFRRRPRWRRSIRRTPRTSAP